MVGFRVAADLQTARDVVSRVEAARSAGTLTKRQFFEAWREMEAALGDGPEAEGLESLTLFADREWLVELDVLTEP